MPILPQVSGLVIEYKDGQSCVACPGSVEPAQISGGGIARICPQLLAVFLADPIQAGKAVVRHIHLPAHRHGNRGGQTMGDGGDGGDVFGHVFANGTVSACGTEGQPSVFIRQSDREPVDFRLHGEENLLPRDSELQQGGDGFGQIGGQLVRAENVGQTAHLHGMRHLGEFRGRCAADMVCGRGRIVPLRIRRFEIGKLPEQRVIGSVGQNGRVLFVI